MGGKQVAHRVPLGFSGFETRSLYRGSKQWGDGLGWQVGGGKEMRQPDI